MEQTVVYQDWNGATLRTKNKSWFDPFEMTCSSITQGSLTARTDYAYSSYGAQVTDKKEWEWDWGQAPACGSSSSGTSRRETQTVYQSFANTLAYPYGPSIFDRPATVTIYGNGAQAAQTTYAYDGSSVQSAGITVGRDSTYNGNSGVPRGNATSKTEWLNGGTSPVTSYTYDDTGQMLTMVDPNGNATSYSYADSYASGSPPGQTNAYLTQITYPNTGAAHVEKYSYNYADGQLASSTDQNGNTTTYSYGDVLDRLTTIDYPDGGETTYSYNDSPPTPSVTTTKKITSSANYVSTSIMDGAGLVTRTELTSDPQGTDDTDTTYDGEGRVWKLSNPYRSTGDPTYGLTTTTYDALGRVTSVMHPDGSTATTSYVGRAVEAIDEGNGSGQVERISQADGLGRTVSVCEVTSATLVGSGGTPAACGQDIAATGFLTTYQYNASDDLIAVTQGSESRAFVYDSLSRLTTVTHPESGTTTYSYDGNGNLVQRVRPTANQTNPAVTTTTTYSYDALNRLTAVSYSDGTVGISDNYDQEVVYGGLDISNPTGHLTEAHLTNGTAAGVFWYDAMGRVTDNGLCSPSTCGWSGINVFQVYDLAGDLTEVYNGIYTGINAYFETPYNAAGQISGVTSSYSDSQHPATLLSGAAYTAGGAMTNATLGNGLSETWGYNNREFLTSHAVGSVYAVSVGYQPDGDVATKRSCRITGLGPEKGFGLHVRSCDFSTLIGLPSVVPELRSGALVDKTGLHGRYSFKLHWTREMPPGRRMPARGGQSNHSAAPSEPSGPSLDTALQAQLGLRVVSRRAPVDVIVIEHIERPTPN